MWWRSGAVNSHSSSGDFKDHNISQAHGCKKFQEQACKNTWRHGMDPSYTIYINFWSGERHSHSTPETNGRAWTSMDEAYRRQFVDWSHNSLDWFGENLQEKDTFQPKKSKVFHGVSMLFSMIILLVTPKIAGFSCSEQTKKHRASSVEMNSTKTSPEGRPM